MPGGALGTLPPSGASGSRSDNPHVPAAVRVSMRADWSWRRVNSATLAEYSWSTTSLYASMTLSSSCSCAVKSAALEPSRPLRVMAVRYAACAATRSSRVLPGRRIAACSSFQLLSITSNRM